MCLGKREISDDVQIYSKVFSLLSMCTEDYLFILNLREDFFVISESAADTFLLPGHEFANACKVFDSVVYPGDVELLQDDLAVIREGRSNVHNMEYRWLGKDGRPIWISCRGQVVKGDDGSAAYLIGRIAEIGRKSKIDGVTGLYREAALRSALTEFALQTEVHGYLLQIGIDNFRGINERYGQEFGDTILSSLAKAILSVVGDRGQVYRMNGDEMIVLVTGYDISEENPAKTLYKEIRHKTDNSVSDSGYHLFYTVSGGCVYFDEKLQSWDKLVEQAGFALHQAKLKGKNTCVSYSQEVYDDYVHTLEVQESLSNDIAADFRGFELYYQPVVNIPKKKILGAEALIRWNSKEFGFMSPAQFIPLLEESGLIIPLGRWIARAALEQCKAWQKLVPGFRINVNLSFVQLKKSDILKDILELIDELQVDRNQVMFEVTESGEIETGTAASVLRAFKGEAIHLAIDDFGTGYSNLRYVRNMTFDLVKIDQSFIRNICENEYDYLVVKQFTELAHALNLTVCYEGVETKEDYECVLELNPDYIQGYYFSKPLTAAEFEEKCLRNNMIE